MTYLIKQPVFASSLLIAASFACNKPAGPQPAGSAESVGKEQPAQQVACGKHHCAAGEVCCNPSCGVCTKHDGMCTQQFCDHHAGMGHAGEPPPPPAALTACDHVRCESGMHCELVQVQCVRAPCDPVPQCKAHAHGDAGHD